jgi:hypothetical protein
MSVDREKNGVIGNAFYKEKSKPAPFEKANPKGCATPEKIKCRTASRVMANASDRSSRAAIGDPPARDFRRMKQ